MKKISVLLFSLIVSTLIFAQETGYYNGTDGINGEELKTALNDIIKDHTQYSYRFAKEIFKISDADPANPNNVIQVYTGFSYDNTDYGNSGLQLNREHVWAKSHGNFADIPPMYGDVHNLKPSASSVNVDKSNLDFDNGGTQHDVATGCYYTDSTWEARDEVKGDIARIIFYMSTRYEGNDGEMDLEVVDHNHTYPYPEHGKLSTLLAWNLQDPPDEFERNRNDVIYSFQKNRNPFIDDPNFAELIWGDATPNSITINDVMMTPQLATSGELVKIEATIVSDGKRALSAKLYWGLSFDGLTNELSMTNSADVFSADIPGQAEDATVYYKIVAVDGSDQNSTVVYNFYVPKIFTGTITSIYDIQGQQADSPYDGEIVSTTGVVTGNFGTNYYIQDGFGEWNGLFIYESGRNPSIGDSIVITGKIDEYYGKTELIEISDYYFISANNTLPDPLYVETGNVAEAHESVLVNVKNAECTDENFEANYGMWEVNDGTGDLKIHNSTVFEYDPSEGVYYNVTGPMNYDFDEWKIELRFESDVAGGGDSEGPSVVEVTPIISTNIRVLYNEAVETTTAETVSNYVLNNDATVVSVSQHAFNKTQVNLTVSPLLGEYDLMIANVQDEAGNVMESQTIPFSYVGIEDHFLNGKLEVFPNPASDKLTVSFSSDSRFDYEISMSDIGGRQLFVKDYVSHKGLNKIELNIGDLQQGLYLLKINAEKGSLSYKVSVK